MASKRPKPPKPPKPPKIDPKVIADEFERALLNVGIDPNVPGAVTNANRGNFLSVLSDFLKKYGPAILPLLQILFSVMFASQNNIPFFQAPPMLQALPSGDPVVQSDQPGQAEITMDNCNR